MKQIFLVFFMLGISFSTANASTLRVTCDDLATGAEVTVNDKYKGECPIDIQLSEGKHSLKAVKKINGKNKTFQEQVRMGDGVTKRIEVTFGASSGAPVTAIRVDQNAVAQQRYKLELAEYNRSIQSCLPKHAVELQRLTQEAHDGSERLYLQCQRTFARKIAELDEGDGDGTRKMCGDGEYKKYGASRTTEQFPEQRALNSFPEDAQEWCQRQFTAPNAP